MKDSLRWLLDKFPYFLDKNTGSNFYKSSSVINESFKLFRQDLFNTHMGHRLEKRVLLWKEQSSDYSYTMNFYVHLPYLKMVNLYKNGSLIYTKSYEYDDEVDTFIYSYDDTSNTVIPSDKYHITVETYEEYVLSKGFPENDTILGDIYDHDKSLDELGALYDIPRKTYIYNESTNPENTEPKYNNRLTEDDYHYMNRILGYISHMQDTPLPVLEVWKLFGIPLDKISLINRERYLCKMYSSVKHGGDNWTPYDWEHKDPMGCFWPEPVFFFVEVDNHTPVLGQSVYFTFTFMNMFGEDKGKDYLIDVYLDGELIESGVDPTQVWEFSTKGVDDENPLVFQFIANPLNPRMEVLESDEIIITIKGCNSADWYVAVDGDDNNPGTKEEPFRTLPKALSMVEGSRNVIVLKKGTFYINNIQVIDTSTSIISCQGATIRNDNNYDFFRILQECNLYLMGITLKHKCCEMYGCDDSFYNFNYTQNPVYLRINPDFMCKPPVDVRIDDVMTEIYAHSSFTVEGTLINTKEDVPVADEEIQLITGDTVVDTDTTDENGEYDFIHELDSLGIHYFKLYHEESLKYCMGESLFNVTVSAMPTTLTCTMDSEVLLDDELIIAYDLVDYYGNPVTVGTVKLYDGGTVVASVTAGEEFDYTPSTVGTHQYKLAWEHDETYIPSETPVTSVIVRKYHTSLFLDCSASGAVTPSDSVTVSGVLSDELGNLLVNQSVKLYDGESLVATKTTNSNGEVSYTGTFSLGKHILQWRYATTRKYEAVNSNSYRLRVKDSSVDEINLYLYPDKRIGVTGTSIGLNVYATDENGSPISTGFKLVDTYNGVCGEYPATSYTTGSDGWWHGNFSTQAIVECHGTYIQAVSTVDTDIYSNTVHVFDVASPLLDTVSEIYSSLSYFDKDTVSVPVNVALYDEVDEPLPLEPFSVKLVSDGTVVSSTTGTSDVRGEADVNISIPASVRGDEITLRIVYTGRANAYNGSSDELTLPYMFSPVLTFNTGKQVYVEGESVTGSCIIKDEFNNLLAGKSIKLYDGATLLDAQVSDNTGNVSFSVSGLVTGQHTLHCEYAGTGLYHDAVSGNVNIMIKKITSLDISVPLVLVYSDEFKITGTLKDSGARGVSGKTVKLLVGSTVVDSLTTNGNGVVEFTRSPVHMGTHSFQLVFDGTTEYVESSSSVVTREIGKETSVLLVSSPVNDASIYVDESLSISGSLVTNDNEKISGATVVVSENGNTLKTLTTNSNGAFTGSLTGLSAGTHSLKFEFVSDQYYTGSTVTRSVIVNNHSYSISANVNRSALLVGDSVTISGVLKKDGVAWSGQTVTIKDGTTSKGTCTTNSNGAYTKTITGLTLGAHSLKAVHTNAESEVKTVNVYDDVVVATVTGNSIKLGSYAEDNWLPSVGDVVIDWGDGTSDTVNNPTTGLSHTYNDGLSNHDITFMGVVTSLGGRCFYECTGLTSVSIPNSVTSIKEFCFKHCTGLTSVNIPNSVTNLGMGCFQDCTGLTSVTIPNLVTSLERYCFKGCTGLTSVSIPNSVTSLENYCFLLCNALIDYQLYWTGNNIITYNSDTMPNNTNTIFTIPNGETANYLAKGYPSAKLVERGYDIILTADKDIIQSSETSTITATLKNDGVPQTSKTLSYQIKHGDTIITSGTKTTNSSGQATISYTGTGVGDVNVIVSYGSLLQETYEVIDSLLYRPSEVSQQGQGGGDYFTPYDNDMSLTLPNKFELSFKFKSTSSASRFILAPVQYKTSRSPNYMIGVQQTSDIRVGLYKTTSVSAVGTNTSIDGTVYHEWKIIRNGNTFQWYFDGVQVNSDVNLTWFDNYTPHLLGFQYWYTGTMTVKDILIKAL